MTAGRRVRSQCMRHGPLVALVAVAALASCRSAYYSTMEAFGFQKREILVDRVTDARDAQAEAKEEFVDALEAFRSVQDVDGGELEKVYDRLKGELADSESAVNAVRDRITAVEQVSDDLFEEWREEAEAIGDPELRTESRRLERDTRARYDDLIAAMRRAEAKMEPVVGRFRDQVTFLKHNLNARAIASLSGTLAEIETDVEALIADMETSIAEADAFLATLEDAG